MILAHVSPVLIFTFWGLLCASFLAGASACIGAFLSRQRRIWFLLCGLGSLLTGSWVAYVAAQAGAFSSWDWFAFVSVAPLCLGVITIVRWTLLSA